MALFVDLYEQLSKLLVTQVHLWSRSQGGVSDCRCRDSRYGKETNLSTEVVGETSIRVEDGQVGTADLADSQLLVTGRTRRVGEVLELALYVMIEIEVSVSREGSGRREESRTSFSPFSSLSASTAASLCIDSSTLPASPKKTQQHAKSQLESTGEAKLRYSKVDREREGRTKRLDLRRSILNRDLNLSNLPHLQKRTIQRRVSARLQANKNQVREARPENDLPPPPFAFHLPCATRLTKAVVFAFSSGVFSSLL